MQNTQGLPSKARAYLELILVSVGSLMAANLWADWIERLIHKKYGNSLTIQFSVALGITVLLFVGLYFLFRNSKGPYNI